MGKASIVGAKFFYGHVDGELQDFGKGRQVPKLKVTMESTQSHSKESLIC